MENTFLILFVMLIVAMVGLVFAVKMSSNLNRRAENGTLYLDRAAEGLWAGDGDAPAGVWAGEGDQLAVPAPCESRDYLEMAKCTYCDGEAFAAGYIDPAMCEKHDELAMVISWLERNGKPVTFETVNLRLALYDSRLSYRPYEVRILLNQMHVVS